MRLREIGDFAREVVGEWQRDNALSHGAALAYYTLFSLTPLLVLIIIIAGLVLGRAAAQGEVVAQIQGLVGPDTARTVQDMVARASTPASGIVPTLVSLAAIVLGASGLVGQLRFSLNQIWGVTAPRGGGAWAMLRQRLVALGVIAGMGMLLLLSALLSAVLDNIPFTAAMVPIIRELSAAQGTPVAPLAWTLALGADIGGNGTPIGASANVVGLAVAEKRGIHVTWPEYVRTAVPVTVAVIAVVNVLILLRYA